MEASGSQFLVDWNKTGRMERIFHIQLPASKLQKDGFVNFLMCILRKHEMHKHCLISSVPFFAKQNNEQRFFINEKTGMWSEATIMFFAKQNIVSYMRMGQILLFR